MKPKPPIIHKQTEPARIRVNISNISFLSHFISAELQKVEPEPKTLSCLARSSSFTTTVGSGFQNKLTSRLGDFQCQPAERQESLTRRHRDFVVRHSSCGPLFVA